MSELQKNRGRILSLEPYKMPRLGHVQQSVIRVLYWRGGYHTDVKNYARGVRAYALSHLVCDELLSRWSMYPTLRGLGRHGLVCFGHYSWDWSTSDTFGSSGPEVVFLTEQGVNMFRLLFPDELKEKRAPKRQRLLNV